MGLHHTVRSYLVSNFPHSLHLVFYEVTFVNPTVTEIEMPMSHFLILNEWPLIHITICMNELS